MCALFTFTGCNDDESLFIPLRIPRRSPRFLTMADRPMAREQKTILAIQRVLQYIKDGVALWR